MNILNLEHITKRYVTKPILTDVTVGLEDTDRIGIVGINGTGKSTLLGIIAGTIEPDEGQVVRRQGLRISALVQEPVFDESQSILTNVSSAVQGREDYWNTEGEVRSTLLRFGIENPDVLPGELSGGQKKRAALAAAILTPCDLLILDEPTNHLDLAMVNWLQEYLQKYTGALLLVTHDRYFLDSVTDQTLELDRGRAFRYEGGYSEYLEQKQERLNFALAAERKMAALYRQDLAWMMRGARARSTKQKAHIARFEALRDREKIVEERQVSLSSLPSRLGNKIIEVNEIGKCYDGPLLFHHFTYLFGKTDRIGIIGKNGCGKSTLLKCIIGRETPTYGSVEIGQTVQIGYFGQENDMPRDTDRVIDYIRDTAEYIRTADGLVSASSMCERFLFDPEMQYAPIGKLSGGEKRRLCLLKVLMENPNVLVLDEPTNDLDIQTLQVLEDYLDRFAGVIICVSHDRYFLDRVVTRIFAFEDDGTLMQSEGGFTEYLEQGGVIPGAADAVTSGKALSGKTSATSGKASSAKTSAASGKASSDKTSATSGKASSAKTSAASGKASSDKAVGTFGNTSSATASAASETTPGSTSKGGETGNNPSVTSRVSSRDTWKQPRTKKRLSYNEQREYDALPDEIDALESRIAELEEEMATVATEYTKLAALSQEKEEADKLLETKMERYLELQDMVDSFS